MNVSNKLQMLIAEYYSEIMYSDKKDEKYKTKILSEQFICVLGILLAEHLHSRSHPWSQKRMGKEQCHFLFEKNDDVLK